jgi:hypothetical protein
MKERPILFSAPMVTAILDGRKIQTRRMLKVQPPEHMKRHCWFDAPVYGFTDQSEPSGNWWEIKCPYGYVGDLLWVRESYRTIWEIDTGFAGLKYAADGTCEQLANWGEQTPFIPATEN